MRCIDSHRDGWPVLDVADRPARRRLVLAVGASAGLVAAGCATRAPSPPSGVPGRGEQPVPPAGAPTAPTVGAPRERVLAPLELPEPRAARDWEEFRRNAGQRLVAAHPGRAYLGAPPEVLFGIPVIETELYVDGTIRSIKVLRVPADARARDTVDLAVAAVRRAAPYGDMSRLSRPWKWVEVFLFNDKRQFKPRSLD